MTTTTDKREQGASLVEFAIAFGLFLLFIGGIVDLARWMIATRSVASMAYEGARFGSSVPELEIGTSQWAPTDTFTCSKPACPNQRLVVNRVLALLLDQQSYEVDGRKTSIQVGRTSNPSLNPADVVTVTVQIPFKSYILKLSSLDWTSNTARVPYLLNQ